MDNDKLNMTITRRKLISLLAESSSFSSIELIKKCASAIERWDGAVDLDDGMWKMADAFSLACKSGDVLMVKELKEALAKEYGKSFPWRMQFAIDPLKEQSDATASSNPLLELFVTGWGQTDGARKAWPCARSLLFEEAPVGLEFMDYEQMFPRLLNCELLYGDGSGVESLFGILASAAEKNGVKRIDLKHFQLYILTGICKVLDNQDDGSADMLVKKCMTLGLDLSKEFALIRDSLKFRLRHYEGGVEAFESKLKSVTERALFDSSLMKCFEGE